MTVIVAAVTADDTVVMAADRLLSAGWQKAYHDAPKLWVSEKYAIGAAGCWRTAQVLKHHVTWPKYRPDEDDDFEAYLVKTLVPAIRSGVAGHGVVRANEGVESIDAVLLLAVAGRIAWIASNGAVVAAPCGRAAIGSGCAEALGRLGDTGPWTEDDVVDAVRRAILTDRGCGGPISVVDTQTLTVRAVDG